MNLSMTIAWRNLWRNRRRTIITMAAVFLALSLAIVMRSWQRGTYKKMISDVVGQYCGALQIHSRGYWDDRTLERSFQENDSLWRFLSADPAIRTVIPRLEAFALASSGGATRGALVDGIDPLREDRFTRLAANVVAGCYLAGGDHAVLVAEKLAEFLHLAVGDTLVLLGQGLYGVTAADQYPVKGLVHFASPQLNDQLVFLTIEECRQFFAAPGRLTSINIDLHNPDQLKAVEDRITGRLDLDSYEVMDWPKLLPELTQQIQTDNTGGIIMLAILYMIAAFGMLSTLLMMTAERRREFSLMIAIGVQRRFVAGVVLWETVWLALASLAAGVIVSLPVVFYFYRHPVRLAGEAAKSLQNFGFDPVLPFALEPGIFIYQSLTVLCLALLAGVVPVVMSYRTRAAAGLNRVLK